jgi:hypothetical protein
MRRFIALALLAVPAIVTTVPAQYPPPPPYAGTAESLVDSWYAKFLNRPRDAYASVWIDSIRQGQHPASVLAKILGSQEYYDKGGGTPEGFVQRLYLDLTGRPPSPQELNYWVQRLYTSDRTDVAYQLLMRYPQSWQAPAAGYYTPNQPGYTPAPDYEYRRPFYRHRW